MASPEKRQRPYWHLPTLHIDEAAQYLGVSLSQFNDQAQVHGLVSRKIMGRVLYRRADLDRLLADLWLGTDSSARGSR